MHDRGVERLQRHVFRTASRQGQGLFRAPVACSETYAEIIPLLIERGADVKAEAKDGTTVLWPLVTLLGRADEKNILDTVKLVLSKGAGVDPGIEGGFTPLMFAVTKRNSNMIKLLIDQGANVNARGKNGETPLSLARQEGDQEVIRLLRSAGAK